MSSSFHNVRFPENISYGVTGGPEYSTDVVSTKSGSEQRNANWYYARHKYNAAHGVKTEKDIKVLLDFFHARMGKAYGFRFKDWADYKSNEQEFIAIADGSTSAFQLVKRYKSGGVERIRKITKTVAGRGKIYVNGELVTLSEGFGIDPDYGKIYFEAPPAQGAVIAATFEFDVPVRFDTDYMPINIKEWNIYSWDSIDIVEIKQ